MASLPAQIGRYQIKSLIGRGGMGDLYLAHDPNTNRLVALKLLNATLDSAELRERFAREARALAALNHPNIVNIYDTGEYDDAPFIVMEYVRGETLAEMIKRRAPLSISQKLKLMSELCAGLAQAHNANIIHRDIKPANLMVDQQGRLKILDFGIARVTEDNRTRFGPLTAVNMMIGTPGYMSPEQLEAGEVDHRSDIFAVGAVCYELLSNTEAFAGSDTLQVERRVLTGKPTPLASLVPGLDPEVDEIVQRALKKEPNKRYQDATTFEKALDRVRARMGPDDAAALPPPPPAPLPAQSVGGKSRSAKAEAAYQRALEAARAGSRDAAKRFAVEALAEDPSHAGARAFLQGLDQRNSPAATQAAAPRRPSPGATSAGTAMSSRSAPSGGSTLAGGSTLVSGNTSAGDGRTAVGEIGGTLGGRTAVSTSAGDQTAAFESAPTIIVTPALPQAPASAPNRFQALWGARKQATEAKAPAKQAKGPSKEASPNKPYVAPPKSGGSNRRPEPLWIRYRWPAIGIGITLAVVLVVGLVVFLTRGPAGQLLTITKPEGGTVSAAGIRCGTRGSDCSTSRPNGDAIELTPQADAGYTFVGYTGDCAPGGRTIMSSPRTCGATFAKDTTPATPAGATQILTISPVPTGGTLEGVDILCGTKGSVCSNPFPDGVTVELHPTADDGFTFMGFKGDCAPLGHTQMTSARTCSATFSPTAEVSAAPTPKPPVARGRSGTAAPAVAQGPAPAQPAVPAPPPPVAPRAPTREGPVVDPTQAAAKPVPVPQTDEEFAKGKIQEMMKAYCDAHEALDPDAVQKIYPRVNMNALKQQLNTSKYRSVQCKFGEPLVYVSLDAAAGKAVIKVPLKQTFFHTILTEKPDVSELMATMALNRSGLRTQWLVEEIKYAPIVK
jgi:protein kinase-like protein/List-Bact-rpt repeat protein